MLRQALRELRFHPSRFVATLIAIAISVAFMAGSSVLVATEQNAVERQQSAPFAGADVVLTPDWEVEAAPPEPAVVRDRIAGTEGMLVAEPSLTLSLGIRAQGDTAFVSLIGLPSEPLRWARLVDGRWPAAAGEIALSRGAADSLGAGLGAQVDSGYDDLVFTVVGISNEPRSIFLQTAYAASEQFSRFEIDPALGNGTWIVKAAAGTSPEELATRLSERLTGLGGAIKAHTAAELRSEAVTQLAGDFDVFRNLLWAFAAVAMVVGMITIANTFTILLAQRRRQIGLLRAVGASGRQVRRRFFLEALLLGVGGSAAGVALGIGLAATGSAFTGSLFWGVRLPAADLSIAFGVGVLITVAAAWLPTLRGTRVRPLEALQPEPSTEERRRVGVVRSVLCGLLVTGGLALALSSLSGKDALLMAVIGSALIAVGVLFGAPLFVPWLLKGLGAVVGRFGVTARLAAQNSVRNPRRAAATATALMLAVGLIVTLQVGTASVRSTVLDEIDRNRPVDVTLVSWGYDRTIPDDLRAQLGRVPGVDAAAWLDIATVDFRRGSDEFGGLMAIGFNTAMVGVAAGVPASVGDDQVYVSDNSEDARLGQQVTVTGPAGILELSVVPSPLLEPGQLMVSPATLDRLGGVVPGGLAWLSVPDRSRTISVVGAIDELVDTDTYALGGGAVEASQIEQILNLLLLITTALLAVAVLIALIGVSNTLGLSVIERTRESALMRALGLQTSSLRWMLLIEALLLALAGVLVGVGAGIFFGWLGTVALSSSVEAARPQLAVDLPQTLGMVVIAILAAALASVLPGRRAARAAPVEALADI